MIPRVIHYCWFGEKRKPKLIKDCIKSWKRHLPNYEIIEWNEKNSDLSHPFVKEAYRLKKWAFVADYVRLKVLYENGGIYLDTDMLVLKSFDDLIHHKCFIGAEDDDFINCAVFGAVSEYEFIKKCLNYYDKFKFSKDLSLQMNTITRIVTKIFRKEFGYNSLFDKKIEKNNLVIYPSSFFYPLSYDNKNDINNYKKYLLNESYTVHLWNESWIEFTEFQYLRKGKYALGLKIALKNIFINGKTDIEYFRKILSCFKESLIKK